MRVAMCAWQAYPYSLFGGAERYVYFLSKYLVSEGVEVKLFTLPSRNAGKEAILDGIRYEFIRPAIPSYGKHAWLHRYVFSLNLAARLTRGDFDLIHSYYTTAYFYLRFAKRKPVAVEPFGSGKLCEIRLPRIEEIFREILLRRPLQYCLSRADAVVADGNVQAQELSHQFRVPIENFFILPDGVELDTIEKYVSRSRNTRQELGIQDADLVLINVNRLDRNKGVSCLIDAMKILNLSLNAKLILVGEGPEEARIERQIEMLSLREKIVHFKGISDEKMFQLYTLADISVTPTLWEGLPLVVLEAMAAGKPIVATDIADIPSVIKGNGIVVPPRDEKAIADAVFKIYQGDLIRAMGMKSKEIIKSYNWGIIAKKAIKMYEELIEKQ